MSALDLLSAFAATFTQEQRLLTLQLGDGGRWGETLLPLAVHGDEAVSDSYRYRVECLSPDTGLELKSLLGVPVRLGIAGADGTEQVRCGVVSAAEAVGSDGGFAKYVLTVEPPFALLRLRKTSRVFQDLSVPDIVRQVFAEHAAANPVFAAVQSLDFAFAGELPPRSYCLQYRESDYDFVVRLLHEEGLAWRFEQGEGATERGSEASRGNTPQVTLVAFDDPYSPPPAGVERVRFHRRDATEEEDGLTRWDSTRQIVSGSVALASFDYQPVATGHSGDTSAVDQGTDGARLQSSLQDYDVPARTTLATPTSSPTTPGCASRRTMRKPSASTAAARCAGLPLASGSASTTTRRTRGIAPNSANSSSRAKPSRHATTCQPSWHGRCRPAFGQR